MSITPDDGGFTPSVWVEGAGVDAGLSATASLELPAGSYDVLADMVSSLDAIVGIAYVPTVTGSPAVLAAGGTADVSVTYAPLPGSGMVWAPSYVDGNVYAYTAAQLAADGGDLSASPAAVLTVDGGEAEAVAFDARGNLFVSELGQGQIWGWTLFADGGASDPAVITLTFPDAGLQVTTGYLGPIAFAPNGDLWFEDYTNGILAPVHASDLGATGQVTIDGNVFAYDDGGSANTGPWGLAFDTQGNAWTVDWHSGAVSEFLALPDGGLQPGPAATLLGATTNPTKNPESPAFDAQGDLWVASNGNCTVVHFSVAGLSGAVDLDVDSSRVVATLGPVGGTCSYRPLGIGFDRSGNLWEFTDNGTLRFSNPSQYVGNVAPTPDAIFTTGLSGDAAKFAFDPPPPGLGLYPVVR